MMSTYFVKLILVISNAWMDTVAHKALNLPQDTPELHQDDDLTLTTLTSKYRYYSRTTELWVHSEPKGFGLNSVISQPPFQAK